MCMYECMCVCVCIRVFAQTSRLECVFPPWPCVICVHARAHECMGIRENSSTEEERVHTLMEANSWPLIMILLLVARYEGHNEIR